MKKRKAKRVKRTHNFDVEISNAMIEQEKTRELKLLNLIAEVLVQATLRDLYDGKTDE